ncbi:AAA family ATPase [Fluoribacter gormanii]|uniref:ATP-dependent nuclease n=1 Tax=Fluoribacter gormanii TaxID=464 RepID=UPI0022431E93|nr:AAA family ATPase [Fluoribacter gormanii]MCW8469372.1 AAA family ATPase [Fluoribacter gormanii]
MYLSKLNISNFRKLKSLSLEFQKGLNVIVGANNIGKSAVVDALRVLLTGYDGSFLRLDVDDIYKDNDSIEQASEIRFHYIFDDLSHEDEADFLAALVHKSDNIFEAHFNVVYSFDGVSPRLRTKRWCGKHEEISISIDMIENLKGVYLPPLRDASRGLMPGKNSQLSYLLMLLSSEESRKDVEQKLQHLDETLREQTPISDTQKALSKSHIEMLGQFLSQTLELGISSTDFRNLCSRISLQADSFDIEQNGMGFNNLIYMAVVLCELAKDPSILFRGLIIEEPEAHLHPQLQAILLDYLENIKPEKGEGHIQIFVTSHSPNFASLAKLNSISCLINLNNNIKAVFPRNIRFEPKKLEKLERYLDVTKAEFFFARRVIFVEGTAELMLVSILAKQINYNLRESGVSLISVEGLNFDSFLPLFGENNISTPVSVITDADPTNEQDDAPLYPDIEDEITISTNLEKIQKCEDKFIKIFHGLKTFEYDLALYEVNRELMLDALETIHPQIGKQLRGIVDGVLSNADKARELYCGMFERDKGKNNVKKGEFAQALAQVLSDKHNNFHVPEYIAKAIKHVCEYGK